VAAVWRRERGIWITAVLPGLWVLAYNVALILGRFRIATSGGRGAFDPESSVNYDDCPTVDWHRWLKLLA